MRSRPFLLAIALTMTGYLVAHADGYVVVRSAQASSSRVSRSELRAMYIGKMKTWSGSVVVTVVRGDTDPVFGAFADQVCGVSTKVLLAKIKQEVFKGEMRKPLRAASDDEVLAALRSTPGSVGVVSASAAKQLPDGVALLQVTAD